VSDDVYILGLALKAQQGIRLADDIRIRECRRANHKTRVGRECAVSDRYEVRVRSSSPAENASTVS